MDFQEEIDYEETLNEVKVDDEEITLDEDFFDNYDYDETQLAKMEEKMEKKEWYVTFYQIDEGYMELEIDEEFDKSKLKWNGESMMYGEDWVGDTSGTKPNSDVDITCQYDSEKDGVSTYFSHTWS